MDLPDWLDAEPCRLKNMAAHFGITPSAAHQWRNKGVPVHRMHELVAYTRGAVSLDEMVRAKSQRHAQAA